MLRRGSCAASPPSRIVATACSRSSEERRGCRSSTTSWSGIKVLAQVDRAEADHQQGQRQGDAEDQGGRHWSADPREEDRGPLVHREVGDEECHGADDGQPNITATWRSARLAADSSWSA